MLRERNCGGRAGTGEGEVEPENLCGWRHARRCGIGGAQASGTGQGCSGGERHVREIEEIGAEVHDLQAGLLDFPYQAESATVMLCWKLGEASVEHWHATSGCTG